MADKWMRQAFRPENRGKLHRALHVPEDETIPMYKIEKAKHAGGHLAKMANAARTGARISRHHSIPRGKRD